MIKRPRSKKAPLESEAIIEGFKVTLSGPQNPLAWFKLIRNSEELRNEIQLKIIGPAYDFLLDPPPRGKHAKSHELVRQIKHSAAYTHSLVKYWKKRPIREWPKELKDYRKRWLKKSVKIAFRDGVPAEPNPSELTRYIVTGALRRDVFIRFNPKTGKRSFLLSKKWGEQENFRKVYLSKKSNRFLGYYSDLITKSVKKFGRLPYLPIFSKNPWKVLGPLYALTLMPTSPSTVPANPEANPEG